MTYEFYKYHGTGNDFIIIDNRSDKFDKSNNEKISELCDRRFGIGADGLIFLEKHDTLDFKMVYYNADGKESSMCGNGGRCITHFAKHINLIKDKTSFEAIDGKHQAIIEGELIKLHMQDVDEISRNDHGIMLDTGSPHIVQMGKDISEINVHVKGAEIRYSESFAEKGINVNFVEKNHDGSFTARTYERGVEAETLSCGTGVTAIALAMNYIGESTENLITLHTPGGQLQVSFTKNGSGYNNIWLIGPAVQVFKGEIAW